MWTALALQVMRHGWVYSGFGKYGTYFTLSRRGRKYGLCILNSKIILGAH